MYRCDWDSCQFKFWSVIDLERHARRHLETMAHASCSEPGLPCPRQEPDPKTAAAPASPSVVVRTSQPIKSRLSFGSDAEQEDDIVCVVCASGRERPGNQIVFCDECDRAFHQACHRPEISPALVADKHAAWFCRGCIFKQ